MTLLEVLTREFQDGTPEKAFADILQKEYYTRFNSDEFDDKFNDVAGYKPIKASAMNIAKNYVSGYDDIDEVDRTAILNKFSEAYDDADKNTINVHAILNGIVSDYIEDDIEEDLDFDPEEDECDVYEDTDDDCFDEEDD